EREVLVRLGLVLLAEPAALQRGGQALRRVFVLARVELAQAFDQRDLRPRRVDRILDCGASGKGCREKHDRQPAHQRKRCWIFTAWPDLTSTWATCAGNVELRISIVCEPGGTSSTRSGGVRPRLLPSSSTSPQGAAAISTRPGFEGFFSGFFSSAATAFLFGLGGSMTAAPPPAAGTGAGTMAAGAGATVLATGFGGSGLAGGSGGIIARADAGRDDEEKRERRGDHGGAAQAERP